LKLAAINSRRYESPKLRRHTVYIIKVRGITNTMQRSLTLGVQEENFVMNMFELKDTIQISQVFLTMRWH
jgi:hypothetical protein